jgi:hypothetical protein
MAIPQRTRAVLRPLAVAIDSHVEYFFDQSDTVPFFYIMGRTGMVEGFGINLAALFGSTGLIEADLEVGIIDTSALAAGILSTNVDGRLKVASGFFDAATVLDKFAAAAIAGSLLADNGVDYAYTATAVTVDHADGSPKTILAADANVDRLVFVQAIATQAAAGGPDVDVGSETTAPNAVFDDLAAGVWKIGERYIGMCVLPKTEKLVCTIASTGTAGTFSLRCIVLTPLVETAQIANGAVTNDKLAGSIADGKLSSSFMKDPGTPDSGVLRMNGAYEVDDTFNIGADLFVVNRVNTDSGDDTLNGDWNNTTDPKTIAMVVGDYPVLSPSGSAPLVVGELVYVGTECMRVTVIAGDSVTFKRGVCGTTTAVHADSVSIYISATRPLNTLATDSGDNTGGTADDFNVVTNPVVVTMSDILYPVLGVGGSAPLTLGELVLIGSEVLKVTDIDDDDVTLKRAMYDTIAAVHADGVDISVSATRSNACPNIQIGAKASLAVADVTPMFAALVNEPAGTVGESQAYQAVSLDAGVELLLIANSTGPLGRATTQVSTNGLWDNVTTVRGSYPTVRQVYRTTVEPSANEAAGGVLYIPLWFTPAVVLVRVVITATGKELETAAALDVQKWDGATTVVAAASPVPAYLKITAGTTVVWDDTCTVHVLAIE